MGIRVVQRCLPGVAVTPGSPAQSIGQLGGPPPHAAVEKPFLLSDGRVELEASLDKAVYGHGEPILVNTAVHNNSSKTVRKIKVSYSKGASVLCVLLIFAIQKRFLKTDLAF
jgi:beta-arrestin